MTHHEGDTDENIGNSNAASLEVDEGEENGGATEASVSAAYLNNSRHETKRGWVTEFTVEDGERRLRVVHGVTTRGDEPRDGVTRVVTAITVDVVLGGTVLVLDLFGGHVDLCDVNLEGKRRYNPTFIAETFFIKSTVWVCLLSLPPT